MNRKNIIYFNKLTGEFSAEKTNSCATAIAGVMYGDSSCVLQHCHFIIDTPEGMLSAVKTAAGSICIKAAKELCRNTPGINYQLMKRLSDKPSIIWHLPEYPVAFSKANPAP